MLKKLRRKTQDVHSDHRAIGKALISIALFVLLGKSIGAAKEMAVAWRYGTGIEVDAYLFVFNLFGWPISVFYGTVYAALIPVAARLKSCAPAEIGPLRAEVLGATLKLSLIATLVVTVVLHTSLSMGMFGLTEAQNAAALRMLFPMALLIPLGWLTALWSTWIMFAGRQISTLLEATPALVVMVTVIVMGGEKALTWGTAAGFSVWALLLLIHMVRHHEIERPNFTKTHSAWPELQLALHGVLIAQLFSSAAGIVDQFFAASLGEGALSTLGYASRLLALVLGLGSTAVGRAVLPVFSNAHARGDSALRALARQWCLLTLAGGVFVMLIGMMLAPIGVAILFERGAFTAMDTQNVANLLRFGLLQIPFAIATIVATYALHSQGMQSAVTKIAMIGFALKVAMNACLVPSLGVIGLLISTAFVMAAMFFLTYWQLKSPA